MTALYLKAIHIVFVVTWFAGLFYMPRLLVYLTESHDKAEPERSILIRQLSTMASRLWFGITWPSAIITLLMGTSLLINEPSWLHYGFMHIKLTLVFFLFLYHLSLHHVFKLLKQGIIKYSSQQLRLWNEVATLFLVSIVFLIVLKNTLSPLWGIAGLLVLAGAIMIGIRIYKSLRKK
jgi:protoporphyrinogen IX oxidase